MKLPLRYGLLALGGLFLLHSYVDSQRIGLLILVAGMGVAMWTAFSLNIAPRREAERNPDLHVVEGHDESPTIGMLGESRGARLVPDLSGDPQHPAQPEDGDWDADDEEAEDGAKGPPKEPPERLN